MNLQAKVILKKDLILYHTSDELFSENKNKFFLFCVFHPSEWDCTNEYIHYIKLKKDTILFFMIDNFYKTRIYSSLNKLVNHPNKNLSKINNNQLKCYADILNNNNFDGWFSSIENKSTIEVALLNNKDLFEIIKSEKMTRNWRNANNLNNIITQKNWGKKYLIYTKQLPVIFKLPFKYKKIINDYVNYGIESKFPFEFTLQIIFNNADFYYYDINNDNIKWNC